jgi:hypothetical protein
VVPQCLSAVERFSQYRDKEKAEGQEKDSDSGHIQGEVPEIMPEQDPVVFCPLFPAIPFLHKELHEAVQMRRFVPYKLPILPELGFEKMVEYPRHVVMKIYRSSCPKN